VLGAAGGVGFSLVRDRFFFEGSDGARIVAHQPATVDWRAELLLGVRFSK
jgi:hypothetical protein